MGRVSWLGLGLAILSLCGASADAKALAVPTAAETLAFINGDQFDTLDERYGAIQKAYEGGAISDVALRDAFRAFYPIDAGLETHYESWVAHSPQSYVAHLARGIYYKFVGMARRGNEYIAKTTPEQIQGMESAFAKGHAEFMTSLELTGKPLLTTLHALDLAALDRGQPDKHEWLAQSLAIDPHNFIVRLKYMTYIQTRWGGGVDDMKAFLRECRTVGLSGKQLATLESLLLEEQGWMAEQDGERACVPCGPINEAADALMHAKSYKAAVKQYSLVLTKDPQFAPALAGQGYCKVQLGQVAEGVAELQQAVDQGNAWAQYNLGVMYLFGFSVVKDSERGLGLVRKARDQHFDYAVDLLRQIHDGKSAPAAQGPAHY